MIFEMWLLYKIVIVIILRRNGCRAKTRLHSTNMYVYVTIIYSDNSMKEFVGNHLVSYKILYCKSIYLLF